MILQDPTVVTEVDGEEVTSAAIGVDHVSRLTLSAHDGLDSLKDHAVAVETEISTPDSEIESPNTFTEPAPTSAGQSDLTIQETFWNSQYQWIDDPIISQWPDPRHRVHQVLATVNDLHREWATSAGGGGGSARPFSSETANEFCLRTGETLAAVGLPWHNNQINMPDEVDTSWPFHFKSFERAVLQAKGARVGDPAVSGYVCNATEANLYCLRALQQELREKNGLSSGKKPMVVFDRFHREMIEAAGVFFGLELHCVHLGAGREDIIHDLRDVTNNGTRPIIFAATLGNADGEADDMGMICEISNVLPLILHVDATRNFDYITTLSESDRHCLGLKTFILGNKEMDQPLETNDGSILASTIVAGGLNLDISAPTVALKPASLGGKHVRVAYTRASDSTLAGSRDAVAILWLALQELQLGATGYRDMYQRCAGVRAELVLMLQSRDVSLKAPPHSLDIIIADCSSVQKERLVELGGIITAKHEVLLTIQPQVTEGDLNTVAIILSPTPEQDAIHTTTTLPLPAPASYSVPEPIVAELRTTVDAWKVATRSAAGYPFHMGSLSALGPVLGRFLAVPIPAAWSRARANELLAARLASLGVPATHPARPRFRGALTTGSTMGNRVGLHAGLAHAASPGAVVYYSAESHYSVAKTLRDCDALAAGEKDGDPPRYAQIPCEADGTMSVAALAHRAAADRQRLGPGHRVVLFANAGTTFVGARDGLAQARDALRAVGAELAYIHVDGALDLGFERCGVTLGPPGGTVVPGDPGAAPLVQGVTLSHHKAMGGTVSGEVLWYSEESIDGMGEKTARTPVECLAPPVEPRVVFEAWLYRQVYTDTDRAALLRYCRRNAARLARGLAALGVATKESRRRKERRPSLAHERAGQDDDSNADQGLIVVLERPPAWITEEFSLRPEGDWVHFVAMPHIAPATIDLFLDRLAAVDRQCGVALGYAIPLLSAVLARPIRLERVLPCQSARAEEIAKKLARAVVVAPLAPPLSPRMEHDQELSVKAYLRGAVSVAVVAQDGGELEAVFLAESLRDMSIRAGPILVASRHASAIGAVRDVAKQLLGLMARHMHARLQTDETSYVIYQF